MGGFVDVDVDIRVRFVAPLAIGCQSSASFDGMLYFTNSIGYNPAMAKKRIKLLTDQLRKAIDESGLTRYRIAKDTGISESALAQFYNGRRGLSMESMNALGEYLELEIVMHRKPPNAGD